MLFCLTCIRESVSFEKVHPSHPVSILKYDELFLCVSLFCTFISSTYPFFLFKNLFIFLYPSFPCVTNLYLHTLNLQCSWPCHTLLWFALSYPPFPLKRETDLPLFLLLHSLIYFFLASQSSRAAEYSRRPWLASKLECMHTAVSVLGLEHVLQCCNPSWRIISRDLILTVPCCRFLQQKGGTSVLLAV